MQRDRPVQEILYEEAFKRKEKLKEKEREIYRPVEKKVNKETQKYVVQRFKREYEKVVGEVMGEGNEGGERPKKINYLALKQLLIKLSFCTEHSANSDSNERVLLYDLWRILEDDTCEEVDVDDLKILLMAVLKLTDHKRIGITPTEQVTK